jgi:hypothetical protein
MNKLLASIILIAVFLSACGLPASEPAIVPTAAPPTAIPTLTVTSEPTMTPKPTETATPKPTETATMVPETDLKPMYEEKIEVEYKGVAIKASIITDESLDPMIKKIYLNPKFKNYFGEKSDMAMGNFISHLFFKVWWANGLESHTGLPKDTDFDNFMRLWSTAQATNNPDDWKKVQMTVKKVNDLNDGNGYKTKEMQIWPMFNGESSDGVRAVSELKMVFVRFGTKKNISLFEFEDGQMKFQMGSNVDKGILYEYMDVFNQESYIDRMPTTTTNLIQSMASIAQYMIGGTQSLSFSPITELVSYLCRINKSIDSRVGGLCAYVPTALKTSPSSASDKIYNP